MGAERLELPEGRYFAGPVNPFFCPASIQLETEKNGMDLFAISKNALGTALAQGYAIEIDTDGCGVVTNPNGTQYQIENFVCSCPAATYNSKKPCKHILYLAQVFICPKCGEWAPMVKVTTHDGQEFREWRCQNRHIYSFSEVQTARREQQCNVTKSD